MRRVCKKSTVFFSQYFKAFFEKVWLCFSNDHLTSILAKENDVKATNQPQENDSEKPSECKIPRTEEDSEEAKPSTEVVEVKVIYNKNKYDVSATAETTIADFKKQLQELLGVPDSMQKLMYKGLLQDNQTFKAAGVTKGAKIMLVGSTLNDVLAVSSVSKQVSVCCIGQSQLKIDCSASGASGNCQYKQTKSVRQTDLCNCHFIIIFFCFI